MLPDPLRLLISAYSAGDLSPRRKSAAVRLLRHSAEARRLLKELKANRRRLRALASPELPADFAARLVDKLSEQPPIIRPSMVVRPNEDRFSRASRIIAAVAVLAAVAIGSYLFGSLPREQSARNRPVATRQPVTPESTSPPAPAPDAIVEQASPYEPVQPLPADTAVVKKQPDQPNKSPAIPPADPLGSTAPPLPRLAKVDPPRLLALPVRDLDLPAQRQRVQQEFRKAEAHHVDLFCKDPLKAFERLQAGLRERGIKLVVDGVAQDALKRKVRGQFLLYCDDLTASEWGQVFQSVAAADKKDGVFDRVVLLPFDGLDKNELIALFGSDLSQPDARRPGAGGGDPKKEVREAFAGGLFPRRSTANSKEIRQFLDGHRDRTISEVAVLLVLRMPSN
jgi:hypothetical protein